MFSKIFSFVGLLRCYLLAGVKRYFQIDHNVCSIVDRNIYELAYVCNNVMYKFRFPRKVRPSNVLKVVDCDYGQDVTTEFLQFMGPSHDFYGGTPTPRFLGFGDIVITCKGNKSIIFAKDCPIAF